jgi:hypothetical protein
LRSPPESVPTFLLLVGAEEVEAGDVGAGIALAPAQVDLLVAARDLLIDGLLAVQRLAALVHVASSTVSPMR